LRLSHFSVLELRLLVFFRVRRGECSAATPALNESELEEKRLLSAAPNPGLFCKLAR
jgi:hypothetical protein